MTIDEQRNHPKWQRKRLEVLAAKGWRCEICGDEDSTLHVHHTFYTPGTLYWEYETEDYKCLCSECHKLIHRLIPNSYEKLFLKLMQRLFKAEAA